MACASMVHLGAPGSLVGICDVRRTDGAPVVLALHIVLIARCVQGLVKFAAGYLVPYPTRIRRIAAYYDRGGRIISIYDTVTLLVIVALVVLLFLTQMQYLSFITGLVAGMLIIQIFFHRFNRVLP